MNLNNENYIKSLLIDYWFKNKNNFILGNEIKYGLKGNYSDLLVLSRKIVTAFEVKAGNDDFRDIRQQLNSYRKVYDFLYLVVTEKHFRQALNIIGPNEGLMLIRANESIYIYKKARRIKGNRKKDILYSITVKHLKEHFNLDLTSSDDIRNYLMIKNLKEIKKVYYKYLINRIIKKNTIFYSERGKVTHFEDIHLLSIDEKFELY